LQERTESQPSRPHRPTPTKAQVTPAAKRHIIPAFPQTR
jgi:hypothetical protein